MIQVPFRLSEIFCLTKNDVQAKNSNTDIVYCEETGLLYKYMLDGTYYDTVSSNVDYVLLTADGNNSRFISYELLNEGAFLWQNPINEFLTAIPNINDVYSGYRFIYNKSVYTVENTDFYNVDPIEGWVIFNINESGNVLYKTGFYKYTNNDWTLIYEVSSMPPIDTTTIVLNISNELSVNGYTYIDTTTVTRKKTYTNISITSTPYEFDNIFGSTLIDIKVYDEADGLEVDIIKTVTNTKINVSANISFTATIVIFG